MTVVVVEDKMYNSDTPSQKPTARLEARVSPELKAIWQEAAALEGRSLTDFVVASVQAAAYAVLERHQKLVLGHQESQAFVQALLNPPEPNAALSQAADRYGTLVQSGELVPTMTVAELESDAAIS